MLTGMRLFRSKGTVEEAPPQQGNLAKAPHLGIPVMHVGLPQLSCETGQVEPSLAAGLPRQPGLTLLNGDANLVETRALRLEFEPVDALQIRRRQPPQALKGR